MSETQEHDYYPWQWDRNTIISRVSETGSRLSAVSVRQEHDYQRHQWDRNTIISGITETGSRLSTVSVIQEHDYDRYQWDTIITDVREQSQLLGIFPEQRSLTLYKRVFWQKWRHHINSQSTFTFSSVAIPVPLSYVAVGCLHRQDPITSLTNKSVITKCKWFRELYLTSHYHQRTDIAQI